MKTKSFMITDMIKVITYVTLLLFIYNSYLSITTYQDPNSFGTGGVSFVAIIMLAVVFFSFVIIILNLTKNKINPLIVSAVIYVIFAILSTVISGTFTAYSIVFRCIEISYWMFVLAIFYYSVRANKQIKNYYILYSVAFVIVFIAFINMAMSNTGRTLLLNPVYYLLFASPLLLMNKKRSVRYVFLLLVFIAIVMSYKRSAMISYVVAVLIYLYYDNRLNKKSFKNTMYFILGVVAVAAIGYFIIINISSLLDIDWLNRMEGLKDDNGSGRGDIWKNVINYFFSNDPINWIFGYGYKASAFLGGAHNDLLEILFDFGFVGLFAYLSFLVILIKKFFVMKKTKYCYYPAFAFSLVIFLGGTMFSQVVIYPYWFIGMVIFWGIIIADFDNLKEAKTIENFMALQHHVT